MYRHNLLIRFISVPLILYLLYDLENFPVNELLGSVTGQFVACNSLPVNSLPVNSLPFNSSQVNSLPGQFVVVQFIASSIHRRTIRRQVNLSSFTSSPGQFVARLICCKVNSSTGQFVARSIRRSVNSSLGHFVAEWINVTGLFDATDNKTIEWLLF